MQLTSFVLLAFAALTTASPSPAYGDGPQEFPSDIQQSVLSLQNAINGVINDIVQSSPNLAFDYSSTGRQLAFLERSLVLDGCAQKLPAPAKTANQAIRYLQRTQLTLSNVALDAINKDLKKGKKDICVAVNTYGGVASYVQKVRG